MERKGCCSRSYVSTPKQEPVVTPKKEPVISPKKEPVVSPKKEEGMKTESAIKKEDVGVHGDAKRSSCIGTNVVKAEEKPVVPVKKEEEVKVKVGWVLASN